MAGNESQGLRYGVIETEEKYYLLERRVRSKNLFETIECFLQKERFLKFIHDFLIFDKGQRNAPGSISILRLKTQEFIHKKEGGLSGTRKAAARALLWCGLLNG